jgi:hypothetical protein
MDLVLSKLFSLDAKTLTLALVFMQEVKTHMSNLLISSI